MNTPSNNQFDACIATCVNFYQIPRECKNLKYNPLTVSLVQCFIAPVWKANGRWFDPRWREMFLFWIFRLLPIPDSSAESLQIKSSMTIHL